MKKAITSFYTFLALLFAQSAFAVSEGGSTHLPDAVSMITDSAAAEHFKPIIFTLLISIIFCYFAIITYRKRQMIPGPLQNVMEMMVEGMYNFIYSILGEDAKKYIPFLGTLFFYILGMNFMGIIPGGFSPSTSISITASLAIMVFFYAQYTGVTRLGIVVYLDHLAGQPRDAIGWGLVILMLPMHIIGEFAKPFSLALRLFGNITGEDILVAAFVGLGVSALAFMHSPIGLPFNVPFILLGILLSTIQALVFTLLSTIYILMMLPHEEHH
jgi:F-type H+-transporting ATPase subunit a